MRPGIFTKVFIRPTLGDVLDAVASHGIEVVQFNLASAALPSLPEELTDDQCATIRGEFERRRIIPAILSATFNIIHPSLAAREAGFHSFEVLACAARRIGAEILSVSTGTLDAHDMWRKHPGNDSPEAWREMVDSVGKLTSIAAKYRVTVAFEPEQGNIVDTPRKARLLLDTVGSAQLRVVIDAANLLNLSNLALQDGVLREAFEILGQDIVAAHAKEFSADGKLGGRALGRGNVNFPLYLSLLRQMGTPVPVILHGFAEDEVEESLEYLAGA